MFKKILFILFSFLIFTGNSFSNNDLTSKEISLQQLLNEIINEKDHQRKMQINEEFTVLLHEALTQNNSFSYPFDSLKNISKLKSPDNQLRIFTWNIPQVNGQQKYFGFIQHNSNGITSVFRLNDSKKSISSAQSQILNPDSWFGAQYYYIHETTVNNKTFYTLLGIDLNDYFTTRRIIDILYFSDAGEIIFGHPLFKIGNNVIKRVIFEYSSKASLSLKWVDKHQMLIFNHLTPLKPEYEGNYQFYVPALTFDGFRFTDGYWVYATDIDVRNPHRENRPNPVVPPEENVEPGFIYKSDL